MSLKTNDHGRIRYGFSQYHKVAKNNMISVYGRLAKKNHMHKTIIFPSHKDSYDHKQRGTLSWDDLDVISSLNSYPCPNYFAPWVQFVCHKAYLIHECICQQDFDHLETMLFTLSVSLAYISKNTHERSNWFDLISNTNKG